MAKDTEHIDWNEVAREEEAQARVQEVKAFAPMAGSPDHHPAVGVSRPDPSDVEALIEPEDLGNLEYDGLDEHLLSDFLAAKRKKEAFEKLEDDLRARIVKALGKERGDILRGTHVVTAKDVSARKSTDWERFVRDVIGEVKPEDLKPYIKEGKPSLRIEVRELKGAVPDQA